MSTQNLQDYVKFLEQQVNDEGRTIEQLKFFRMPTTSSIFQMPALPMISPPILPSGKSSKRATRAISPPRSRSSASIFELLSHLPGAALDNFAEHVEKRLDLIRRCCWLKRHTDRSETISMPHGRQHMAGADFSRRAGRSRRQRNTAEIKGDLHGFGLLLIKGKERRVRQPGDRLSVDQHIRGDRLQPCFKPVPHRRGPAFAVQPRFGNISRNTKTCNQRQSLGSRPMSFS